MLKVNRHSRIVKRFYRSNASTYGHAEDASKSEGTDSFRRLPDSIDWRVNSLVQAYRKFGHNLATLDPLRLSQREKKIWPELDPKTYHLRDDDLSKKYSVDSLIYGNFGGSAVPLSEIIQHLRAKYCGPIAAEYDHLETSAERDWFAENYEKCQDIELSSTEKQELAKLMLKCQNFDNFLALKFATVKRYGGEGAESMMGFFSELFSMSASSENINDIVLCMPHRGRLNLLTTMLQFPAVIMFQKMKGKMEFPPGVQGHGDVLSHLTASVDLKYSSGSVHVTMIPNPSHLEANNPVAVGKARGRMQSFGAGDYSRDTSARPGDEVLCVQVHGDASMAGQGIVPETSMLSFAPNFRVGGSIHLAVNNQIGFTTEGERGRSCNYCTDVAKLTSSPVIHVNGEHPEMVVKATRLAMAYRERFRKDIFVDLVCYRRWGHNELDDPSFTQPLMYDNIQARKSIPDLYAEKLVNAKIASSDEFKECVAKDTDDLMKQFGQVDNYVPEAKHLTKQWSGFVQAPKQVQIWDTGVSVDLLRNIGTKSVAVPDTFNVHPHLKKTHCEARLNKLNQGSGLDWATAESLAIGSLLDEGVPVRLSGQDVGRGTFSNRHAMLVDRKTDEMYIPLNNMRSDQTAFFEVANSILSEEAVLGFEYGMAIESPHRLVIWEAQFGDFFNGAQIIIDTFITGGESKWLLQNGLVMLLPHGYDGAGPEHSSCRIERFLQQCDSSESSIDGANINMEIVHPTTSAQYFHLLRRQIRRNYRKPLVVVAPKILLRLGAASSSLEEMSPGTYFQTVLGDPKVTDPTSVTKVIICSGKHYYALNSSREAKNLTDCAIIRLEALCPFPAGELAKEIRKYPNAKAFTWSQEEPRNMGPWSFVRPRLENLLGLKVKYVGRLELPIPAVAIGEVHQAQHAEVLKSTFL